MFCLNFCNLEILVGKQNGKNIANSKKMEIRKQIAKKWNHKFQRKKVKPKPHNQHVFLVSNFPNLAIHVRKKFEKIM